MSLRFLPSILAIAAITTSCTAGQIDGVLYGDVEGDLLTLEGDALAAELATSPVHQATAPFRRIGVVWDADQAGAIEFAVSSDGVSWSAWAAAEVSHIELERKTSFVGQLADGEDRIYQYFKIRAGVGVATYARLELLATSAEETIEDGEESTSSGPSGFVSGLVIGDRASWGARRTRCSSRLGDAYRMAIHHTETPTNDSLSPQARLRQIQSYHMDVRGWCDIGYHYLISRDGRIWEGRPSNLRGAHAGGANTGNVGISVMGSHDATPISEGQMSSISALVAAVAEQEGVAINRSQIKGHREYKPTSCPGNALFAQLEEIVDRASGSTPNGNPDSGEENGEGDAECGEALETDGPWSCSGLTGTTTNPEANYFTTSFGCWVDENGVPRSDSGDNCIPACSLSSIGCDGLSGPECERQINWFAAGSDRWGCGTLLRVTNPDNGKTAVLKVIDRGPNCRIERTVDHWVVDMSYRASYYLFGEPTAATERADVDVEVMPGGTPVGPSFGDFCEDPTVSGVTVIGVLYAGSNTSERISGATVTLGDRTTTTNGVGLWSFDGVAEGPFSVTASSAGYETRTISSSTYAAESWASFGLSRASAETGDASIQGVIYRTSDSSNRIAGATVTLSSGHVMEASDSGYYKFTDLPAGEVTITASAPEYESISITRELVDGYAEWGSVRLE